MAEAQPQTVKEMIEDDAMSIRDWMDGMVGEGALRVLIIRKRPEEFNGRRVGGSLETVEEQIDEEYISDVWGGGTFQLKVSVPTPQGGWKYFRARTIKIAGDPKMHGQDVLSAQVVAAQAATASPQDTLAHQAFGAMERNMRIAQERAAALEERAHGNGHNSAMDYETISALNAPLIEQLRSANETVRELQARIFEGSNQKGDPFRDRLMEKMIDGESSRIEALRQQFESERRQERERHQAELDRLRDNQREDIKALERRHEREIQMLQNSADAQVRSNEVAYNSRVDGLKSENDRLNRELTELRSEIGSLRMKKDQSLTEKAEELIKVKDALSGLGEAVGAEKDDENKPWYERIIGTLGNSEAALTVIEKLTGGGQAQQAQQQQQEMLPPVGVPFQGPDGRVYVRQPDNSIVDVAMLQQRRKLAQLRRKRAAAAGGAPEQADQGGGDEGELPDIDAELGEVPAMPVSPDGKPLRAPEGREVALAIRFMEGALANGTDPQVFAKTAASMIPADILRFIQAVGVDEFLNSVARLEPGSSLTTQNGRNFARAVAKTLLEGSPT